MIEAHTNAIEAVLLAQSQAAQNAGHPNLRGGPREWFVREFLEGHLPGTLEVGQGEIIDEDSRPTPAPGDYRPQVDVVVYRRDLPKIAYSRTDSAYLAEGVMATIEVKSVLDQEQLKQASEAASKHHSLRRSYQGGAELRMNRYLVAYSGPQHVRTAANWLPEIASELNISAEQMLDFVLLLGKGVIWRIDCFPEMGVTRGSQGHEWAYIEQDASNLYILFTHMLAWMRYPWDIPDTSGYVARTFFSNYQTV
jgi:hypothetical protein